jgi:hypothetical protein
MNEGFNSEEIVKIQKVEAFNDSLKKLPFIEFDDLFSYATVKTESVKTFENIPVKNILCASVATSWFIDRHRGADYIYDLAKKIKNGLNLEKLERPSLFEIEGLYGISSDGSHRVAALKGLDNEKNKIKTEVCKIKPFTEICVFSEEDFVEISQRQKMGLWQGTLEIKSNYGSKQGFYATGKIESYEGLWVFSKNMPLAKEILTQAKTTQSP